MTTPLKIIPEHRLLSDNEAKKVLEKFNISIDKLPKILESDPQVIKLGAKFGQIIEIKRVDPTGTYIYYRTVIKD
ncbi:MAG: DNA-directed RNA polymerase subunit H [Candidatus Marsarchaeota archaeon]|nr:DNA-directed RNA polymerase subunit H [Candidatus Marsarchaeota archaeon]